MTVHIATRIGTRQATRLSKSQARHAGLATPPVYVSTRRGREAIAALHAKAPKEWRPIDRAYRRDWLRHRLREYVNVHGYASAGVCTLLEKAAAAYADGDYLRALGMSQSDPELLRQAHQLNDRGKQMELAAYEIAVREGKAKIELDRQERKGAERLAHVLQETREERAKFGHASKKKTPDIMFGGITYTKDDPWPGADASTFDQKPPEPAPNPHRELLAHLQRPLGPSEREGLDQKYAEPEREPGAPRDLPRGASGRFISENDDPEIT